MAAALEQEAGRRRVSVSQVAREAIETRLGWDHERDIPFIGPRHSSQRHGSLSEHIDSDELR